MKSIFPIICFSIAACSHNAAERPGYMDIAVISDTSDIHTLHPDATSILSVFNLSEHKNEAVTFRYSEISDKILVPVITLRLPDASATNQKNRKHDPLYREKTITSFYDTIKKTLGLVKSDTGFLNRSQCFRAICRELSYFHQSGSRKKILLVYSNLYENSDITSVYTTEGKEFLLKDPQAIGKLFEKTNLLPHDLTGITAVFIYQPLSIEDDKAFNAMVNIYKLLLETRKAKVMIQASNTFYKL